VADAIRREVPGAEVGVEVYDLDSDIVLTSLDADQQFASMSVVKLLIAIDALASGNWAAPTGDASDQLTQMLSDSDDDIASSLWDSDGGTAIISRMAQLMGLTGTAPPADPGEWGDTMITAQDMVTVYRYLSVSIPGPARDFLYNAMYHASERAADGTDQYFGIPGGLPGTTWAIKQGWGSSGDEAYFNTTGLIGKNSRFVVVVLSSAALDSYGQMAHALTSGTAQLAGLVSA